MRKILKICQELQLKQLKWYRHLFNNSICQNISPPCIIIERQICAFYEITAFE